MNKKNALKIEKLTKIYSKNSAKEIKALNNLNLEVKEGEIFGLLGLRRGPSRRDLAFPYCSNPPQQPRDRALHAPDISDDQLVGTRRGADTATWGEQGGDRCLQFGRPREGDSVDPRHDGLHGLQRVQRREVADANDPVLVFDGDEALRR